MTSWNWLRQLFMTWWHQAITWSNVNFVVPNMYPAPPVHIFGKFPSRISEINYFGYTLSKMSPGLKILENIIPSNNAFAWKYLTNWWLASLWCISLSQAKCIYSLRLGSSVRTIFSTEENRVWCSSFHESVVLHLSLFSCCCMREICFVFLTNLQQQIAQKSHFFNIIVFVVILYTDST